MRKSVHTAQYKKLLAALVAARHEADLTQQELADRLKRPQSFVAKVEKGERRIDVIEFLTLADAIGADPIRLLRAIVS